MKPSLGGSSPRYGAVLPVGASLRADNDVNIRFNTLKRCDALLGKGGDDTGVSLKQHRDSSEKFCWKLLQATAFPQS